MEKLFTKGEWKVSGFSVSCKGEGYIAKALEVFMCKSERKANAHLIAAAPEMYEEIERDVDTLSKFVDTLKKHSNDWIFYTNELRRKIFILAKARGE